jgi:hypothetical protein
MISTSTNYPGRLRQPGHRCCRSSPIAAIEVSAAQILSRTIRVTGVWIAHPLIFCATFVLQAGFYLVWRKRPIEKLV